MKYSIFSAGMRQKSRARIKHAPASERKLYARLVRRPRAVRLALMRASGFSPILPLHRVPSLAIARFSAIVPMHAGDAEVK